MMLVYAVRDAKADMFIGNPIFVVSRGVAVRSFVDEVNDPQSQFGKYPADFSLYEIGSFDPANGLLEHRAGGILDLGNGLSYINRKE